MNSPAHVVGAPSPAPWVLGRAATGGLLTLSGSFTLVVLWFLAYGQPPGYEMILINFGMPLTVLTSGLAQIAVLVGLWLLWTVQRRRPQFQRPRF